jgi:hypothetical protein
VVPGLPPPAWEPRIQRLVLEVGLGSAAHVGRDCLLGMVTRHPERRESVLDRHEVLAEEEFFPLAAARAKRRELAAFRSRLRALGCGEHEAAMKM